MITDIMICGIQETQNHIRYLEQTPVRELADLLRSKHYVLKKGNITSLNYLGSLKTEFGELGGIKSMKVFDRNKFLVSEVMTILRRSDCSDKISLQSIEYFTKIDGENKLELKITIFNDGTDYIIKDGNKRAVAFYERRININKNNIIFPIYLIDFADGEFRMSTKHLAEISNV